MKKTILLLLCAGLVLSLAACGGSPAPESTPVLTELAPVEPTADPAEEASAAEAAALAEAPVPASASDAALDETAFAAAQSCVGLGPEELYAAVGEPSDSSYAASCLEENAEDGMLFYRELGFYVWTVRGESGEVIHAVYPLD